MNSTEELLETQVFDEPKMERAHYNEDSMRIELNWWQSSLFFVGCLPCIFCMTVCGAVCCLATAACCLGTTLLGAATYCGTCCCCSNCCGGCKTKLSERRGILKNKNDEQCSTASSFSRTTQKHQEEILHCTRNVPDINSPSTSTAKEEVKKPLKGILRNKGEQSSHTNSSSASQSSAKKERNPLQKNQENKEKQSSVEDSSTFPELSSNIGNSQENLIDAPNEKKPPEETLRKNEGQAGRSGTTSALKSTNNMGNSKEKLLDSIAILSDDEGSSIRDSLQAPSSDKEATDEALLSATAVNKVDQNAPKESSSHSEFVRKKKKSRLLSLF